MVAFIIAGKFYNFFFWQYFENTNEAMNLKTYLISEIN